MLKIIRNLSPAKKKHGDLPTKKSVSFAKSEPNQSADDSGNTSICEFYLFLKFFLLSLVLNLSYFKERVVYATTLTIAGHFSHF